MRKVCITYHMQNSVETAETCITLPMEDSVAESLLQLGNDSIEMWDGDTFGTAAFGGSNIVPILKHLAALQGYRFVEAVHFEDVTEGQLVLTGKTAESRRQAAVKDLRERYPKGTRLVCMKMDDLAAVPAGTVGSVVLIDDIGQIHMQWDNGRSLALVPEVDRFAKIQKRVFLTPLAGTYRRDHYDDEQPLVWWLRYIDDINQAIKNSLGPNEHPRGLAEYLDEGPLDKKVYSILPAVTNHLGCGTGAIRCELREALTEAETLQLLEYISGQLADGWGSSFAQQELKVHDGEIQVYFWATDKDNSWGYSSAGRAFTEIVDGRDKKYNV